MLLEATLEDLRPRKSLNLERLGNQRPAQPDRKTGDSLFLPLA